MSRPPFYAGTAPPEWLRTPRNSQSPAEYAAAVERFSTPRNRMRPIFTGVCVLLAVVLLVNVIARLT